LGNGGTLAAEGIAAAARELFRALAESGLSLACAESCTGGLVAASLTDMPGSSSVLWGGVVAYSNECKSRLLGVSPEAIAEFGAVSREVARAMVEGVIAASRDEAGGGRGADIALAITGIAGPEGGSAAKPVGLVWLAFRDADGQAFEESAIFPGDRRAIREAAAERAMMVAAAMASGLPPATGRY
jgi:nicotinamide-nucleotide amidase